MKDRWFGASHPPGVPLCSRHPLPQRQTVLDNRVAWQVSRTRAVCPHLGVDGVDTLFHLVRWGSVCLALTCRGHHLGEREVWMMVPREGASPFCPGRELSEIRRTWRKSGSRSWGQGMLLSFRTDN